MNVWADMQVTNTQIRVNDEPVKGGGETRFFSTLSYHIQHTQNFLI